MKKTKYTEAQIVFTLKHLEAGNARLKQILADLALYKQILQDVRRKISEAGSTAGACLHLLDDYWVSFCSACIVILL